MKFGALVLLACIAQAATPLTALRGHTRLVASESPYVLNRSMVLSMTDTLTIEPGVEIQVSGYHKLMLRGEVRILGTENQPVRIVAQDSSDTWVGLHLSTGDNPVLMQGLVVRNAFRNSFSGVKGLITKSLFEGNFYALWVEDSPNLRVSDCTISHNRFGITVGSDSLQVSLTKIQGNVIGIWLEGLATVAQTGNTLSQNGEYDISTPKDPSRQGLSSRYSRRTLQTVESRF